MILKLNIHLCPFPHSTGPVWRKGFKRIFRTYWSKRKERTSWSTRPPRSTGLLSEPNTDSAKRPHIFLQQVQLSTC
ncbi:hypothetical protein cypCar_00003843 [Cyprinus carpio]|nr:hypothetical protein cypCar_00003843 [Cyprinus carpio]